MAAVQLTVIVDELVWVTVTVLGAAGPVSVVPHDDVDSIPTESVLSTVPT